MRIHLPRAERKKKRKNRSRRRKSSSRLRKVPGRARAALKEARHINRRGRHSALPHHKRGLAQSRARERNPSNQVVPQDNQAGLDRKRQKERKVRNKLLPRLVRPPLAEQGPARQNKPKSKQLRQNRSHSSRSTSICQRRRLRKRWQP